MKPYRCSRFGRNHGFTLVETLVAIVILMMVIGAIYGTFRAGNMCVSRTEERADVYQTARVLMAQINAELCSAYQPTGATKSSMTGEDTPGSETATQYDTLTFTTTTRHSPSQTEPAGDVCQVSYHLGSTPDGEPGGFFVAEDFRPGLSVSSEKRPPIKLSDMVVGFNCKYLDPQSDEWKNEWVDQTRMPKAVRIELILKPERKDAKPITVASTANIMMSPITASAATGSAASSGQ
jgi:general secretion pathway protein J